MEAIREGVEDYEYLVILRDRFTAARPRGVDAAALAPARRLLDEAGGRVCPEAETESLMWMAERDRTAADRVRLEILAAIEKLK